MNRREAIDAGLLYFSTGKPCKYGHQSRRYVGNGACVECLRPGSQPAAVVSQGSMVQFSARVFDADLEFVRTLVYVSARQRSKDIRHRDVWKPTAGTKRQHDSAIHVFKAFPDDVEILRKAAVDSFNERTYIP